MLAASSQHACSTLIEERRTATSDERRRATSDDDEQVAACIEKALGQAMSQIGSALPCDTISGWQSGPQNWNDTEKISMAPARMAHTNREV